ncbi:MAG: hypothetical protein IJF64_03975 [Clostridia bacterium]|nr:hypothetical protein [Clostridia bacterium]
MERLFRGVFEHQLDDKGRLRIPAKFKKKLEEFPDKTYSFVRGLKGRIYVFPDSVLDEILEEIADEKISESSKGSLMLFSSVFPAEEDAQGRVTLPSKLREAAKIKKDIVTVGMGKRLEIWSAESYEEYLSGVDYDQEIGKLGI